MALVRTVACLLFLVTFTGCTTNLERDPIYRPYVKKELTTKRPARLVERQYSNITMWHGGVPLKRGELYQLVNVPDPAFDRSRQMLRDVDPALQLYGEEIAVPVGTPLRIRKIYSWMDGSGNIDIRAEGKIFVTKKNTYVPFEFTWGRNVPGEGNNFAGGEIYRAPWEENVADVRAVRYDGRSLKK